MKKIEDFLTKKEEEEIVQAIIEAERNTSGEIRVHIEEHSKKNHAERTHEVFRMLKMENTKLRNAVLIYIAVADKYFQIYGDEGINNVVPNNFWETTCDVMQNQFKKQKFKQGIIDGILKIGEELKNYFPYDKVNDVDELPNEISRS